MPRHTEATSAVAAITSGQRVFVHGGVAAPLVLLDALVGQAPRLHNVELIHLHTSGPARYADAEFANSFRIANLFVGPNLRGRVDLDRVDYPWLKPAYGPIYRSDREVRSPGEKGER